MKFRIVVWWQLLCGVCVAFHCHSQPFSVKVVGHPGTFHLLFYEHYKFWYSTNFTFCTAFHFFIIGK